MNEFYTFISFGRFKEWSKNNILRATNEFPYCKSLEEALNVYKEHKEKGIAPNYPTFLKLKIINIHQMHKLAISTFLKNKYVPTRMIEFEILNKWEM